MMFLKLFWFFLYIFKNMAVALIGALVVGVIFPPAGGIIFLLAIIGGLSNAWEEAGNKYLEHETQGFDEALRKVRRNII